MDAGFVGFIQLCSRLAEGKAMLALRAGQALGAIVMIVGLVDLSFPLILQGSFVLFGIEWVIRRKPDWIGLARKGDE